MRHGIRHRIAALAVLPCLVPAATSAQRAARPYVAQTLGAVLDYNFLIGRRKNFLIGLGLGAERVLGPRQNGDALGRTLADGRLQVGFGF